MVYFHLPGQHENDFTPPPKKTKVAQNLNEEGEKQITKMQQEKEKLQHDNHTLQQQLQEYKTQVQEKDAVIEAKERELRELNQQLASREQKEQTLQEKIQHLQQTIQEVDEIMQQPTVLSMSWKKYSAAPTAMLSGSTAVRGSMAYFSSLYSREVLSYNSDTEYWSALPECPIDNLFTLAVVHGLITAVGGKQSGNFTNTLFSLIGESRRRKWMEHFPRMPTKRGLSAVACFGRALVVAGGRGNSNNELTTVEVMDTDNLQWSTASSLPHPLSNASMTVCGKDIYLMGRSCKQNWTKAVLTCSLSALLQSYTSYPCIWHRITDLAVENSTCTALNGQLLAVGGQDSHEMVTNNIYFYNQDSDSWEVISHMPTPRYQCLVAVLPHNELMVVGGWTTSGDTDTEKKTGKVEISTLE